MCYCKARNKNGSKFHNICILQEYISLYRLLLYLIYIFIQTVILPTTLWCASFKIWPVMKGEIDIENYAIMMILYTRTCLPYVIFVLRQVQTASFRLEYAQTQLEIDMLSN